jgi:mRNA interferase RelE/StbE
MSYQLFLKRSAEKELSELTGKTHDRIVKKLLEMRENPLPRGVRKLQGREGYRIRMGHYRILYTIDETQKKIEIFSIAHRQEVYKR